jgi:hypothetical protein
MDGGSARRKAATCTQNKRMLTFIPRMGFESTIPAFERGKRVHALDRAGHCDRLRENPVEPTGQEDGWTPRAGRKENHFLGYSPRSLSAIPTEAAPYGSEQTTKVWINVRTERQKERKELIHKKKTL